MQKQKRIIILQIILLNRIKGRPNNLCFWNSISWFFHENDFTKKKLFKIWILNIFEDGQRIRQRTSDGSVTLPKSDFLRNPELAEKFFFAAHIFLKKFIK